MELNPIELPLIFKEKSGRRFRWFIFLICLPLGLLAIFAAQNEFEFYVVLGVSITLFLLAENFHRNGVRRCGLFVIEKNLISYKSRAVNWTQSIDSYKKITWFEQVYTGVSASQSLNWKFTIQHKDNEDYSVVFDQKLLPARKKSADHYLWRQLAEQLNLPAESQEDLSGRRFKTEGDVEHKAVDNIKESNIEKNSVKTNSVKTASIKTSSVKNTTNEKLQLKRSALVFFTNIVVSPLLITILVQQIQDQGFVNLWAEYSFALVFLAVFWLVTQWWGFTHFQFLIKDGHLLIKSVWLGKEYNASVIDLSNIEEVNVYNNPNGSAQLVIGYKNGENEVFRAIKNRQAVEVKNLLVNFIL